MKHHLIADAQRVPLAVRLTGGHRHDMTLLIPLADAIPSIVDKFGRTIRWPEEVFADRVYDSEPRRSELRQCDIKPSFAERNAEHGGCLGIFRWVVERTINWLRQFRCLRIRYERRAGILLAFLTIGCIVICHRYLNETFC